jgi:predicted amidophosphoribosyltransferase
MKREEKQETVRAMIRYFCKAKHREGALCAACRELLRYITARLNECRLPEESSACFMCPDYCYKPEMRDRIKEVMRFSAPRILIRHPVLMFRHLNHLRKLHRQL